MHYGLNHGFTHVEEAGLQQFLKVADDAHIDQHAHIVCLGLRQLLALQPLCKSLSHKQLKELSLLVTMRL